LLVLPNPIRGDNRERRDRNKDELEPVKKWNAEKNRWDRIVEWDPERQNTGRKQKDKLHISPKEAHWRP